MERERPDYLPPIQGRRWEFPWMLAIGIALLAIMAGGLSMLVKTNAAWADRFDRAKAATEPVSNTAPVEREAEQQASLAEIEAKLAEQKLRDVASRRREGAEHRAVETRCVSGTLFRRIPGGWENVPGQRCSP